MSDDELLTADTVTTYLIGRGVLDPRQPAHAVELSGGVSNVVLSICQGDEHLICKQSLSRLRVADEWLADRNRVFAEAAALQLCAGFTPGYAPRVVDVDQRRCAIVLEHAPTTWRNWKTLLLDGRVAPTVAGTLGDVLGRWQSATAGGRDLPELLRHDRAFDQLRIDPYYRTVARRHSECADAVLAAAAELSAHRQCLVHGDFSPKNVLVAPANQCWVIDFEVAHWGDPAFDVAFLLSHLLMKSVHLSEHRDRYGACVMTFAAAWERATRPADRPQWTAISRQLGALLLARVDGKSPAEYLTANDRRQVWSLGRSLLENPAVSVATVWDRVSQR